MGGRDGDWMLVSGNYDGMWTILQFTRKLQTGDANGDRDVIEVCASVCDTRCVFPCIIMTTVCDESGDRDIVEECVFVCNSRV